MVSLMNRTTNAVAFGLIISALGACAYSAHTNSEDGQNNEYRVAGAVVSVPLGSDWIVQEKTPESLYLVRRTSGGNQTVTAVVIVMKHPEFETEEDYFRYLHDRRWAIPDNVPPGIDILLVDESAANENGVPVFRTHMIYEDFRRIAARPVDSVRVEHISAFYLHPMKNDRSIYLYLSQETTDNAFLLANFDSLAAQFVNSVELNDIGLDSLR